MIDLQPFVAKLPNLVRDMAATADAVPGTGHGFECTPQKLVLFMQAQDLKDRLRDMALELARFYDEAEEPHDTP